MFIIISFFTQFYIFRKLREARVSNFSKNIFVAWGIFCALIFVASDALKYSDLISGRFFEIAFALSFTWVIITILGFFAFLVIDRFTNPKRFNKAKVFAAIILTLIGVCWCLSEAYFVQPRHVVIKTSKLPAHLERVRITFLTDLHIGGVSTHWHFDRVMKIVNDSDPDIFATVGDILDGDMSFRNYELSELSKTSERARGKIGAFAVHGNHEYYLFDRKNDKRQDINRIISDDCGLDLLIDERREISDWLVIIGVDDKPSGWLRGLAHDDDSGKFVLLMKHRPGLLYDQEGKFDLQISGHTHGGQFFPLGYFKNHEYDSVQGLSFEKGSYVYVSNGAGFNAVPMRLFTPPEVTIIDLIRE